MREETYEGTLSRRLATTTGRGGGGVAGGMFGEGNGRLLFFENVDTPFT